MRCHLILSNLLVCVFSSVLATGKCRKTDDCKEYEICHKGTCTQVWYEQSGDMGEPCEAVCAEHDYRQCDVLNMASAVAARLKHMQNYFGCKETRLMQDLPGAGGPYRNGDICYTAHNFPDASCLDVLKENVGLKHICYCRPTPEADKEKKHFVHANDTEAFSSSGDPRVADVDGHVHKIYSTGIYELLRVPPTTGKDFSVKVKVGEERAGSTKLYNREVMLSGHWMHGYNVVVQGTQYPNVTGMFVNNKFTKFKTLLKKEPYYERVFSDMATVQIQMCKFMDENITGFCKNQKTKIPTKKRKQTFQPATLFMNVITPDLLVTFHIYVHHADINVFVDLQPGALVQSLAGIIAPTPGHRNKGFEPVLADTRVLKVTDDDRFYITELGLYELVRVPLNSGADFSAKVHMAEVKPGSKNLYTRAVEFSGDWLLSHNVTVVGSQHPAVAGMYVDDNFTAFKALNGTRFYRKKLSLQASIEVEFCNFNKNASHPPSDFCMKNYEKIPFAKRHGDHHPVAIFFNLVTPDFTFTAHVYTLHAQIDVYVDGHEESDLLEVGGLCAPRPRFIQRTWHPEHAGLLIRQGPVLVDV